MNHQTALQMKSGGIEAKKIPPGECPGASCRDRWYRWILRRIGSADDAEDLCGEVCLRCLRGKQRFRGESQFQTWLHRVARNVLADYLRARQASAREAQVDLEQLRHVPPVFPASFACDISAYGGSFDAAYDQLPPRYRQLLDWKYGDQLTYAEIAERLNLSGAAVSQALYRARRAFKRAYVSNPGPGASIRQDTLPR